jgi:KUP system potassium uptake protein
LGVVFGDIGTSPLYTLKTVLGLTGGGPDSVVTLGVLSLVIWTLIVVTTIKYVSVAMRVDNDGEGGILALMSLLGVKRQHRPIIIAFGLFGAALIYGDGAITPAISVLSALEGLDIIFPAFAPYVLPVSVLILVALFAIQPQGTARLGRAFGPIMALWFATIAVLGIWGISRYPSVLLAIDPRHGLSYLLAGGGTGFLVLGGVFLCVTGAEALYADMGHFGAGPIRLAWSVVVFPSLVLNYAGQAALVLAGAPSSDNIFYRLCPPFLLLPLVVLATIATIIASQSIITGAFSMTRQAIQLGWLPRLHITQTSAEGYGQIYVGSVNWLLMLVTLGLTVGFGKSDNLASAYGIAVSATMLMTSALLFIAMREIWGWSLLRRARSPASSCSSMRGSSQRTSQRWRKGDMCRLSWPGSFTASCLSGISEPQLSWPGFRMRLCPSEHSWRRSRRDPSPACPARRSSSRGPSGTCHRSWCGMSSTTAHCTRTCSS